MVPALFQEMLSASAALEEFLPTTRVGFFTIRLVIDQRPWSSIGCRNSHVRLVLRQSPAQIGAVADVESIVGTRLQYIHVVHNYAAWT